MYIVPLCINGDAAIYKPMCFMAVKMTGGRGGERGEIVRRERRERPGRGRREGRRVPGERVPIRGGRRQKGMQ